MKSFFIFIFLLIGYIHTYGQVKGFNPIDPESIMKGMDRDMSSQMMQKTDQYPVGNIVSAEHYYVGPGDVLYLQILPRDLIDQTIIVSPENSITIPRIGTINLSGLTLSELRDSVRNLINSRVGGQNISLTLIQSRQVLVTIKGNVLFPGNYYLPASYQVSTAIRFANQTKISSELPPNQSNALLKIFGREFEKRKSYSESGLSENVDFQSRNISLIHNDGTSKVIDLLKAKVSNPYLYDPFIREGDIIEVPFDDIDFPTISINGAIINPMTVQFRTGDKASFLLKLGYSSKQEADIENVFLFNDDYPAGLKLSVDTALNILSNDIPLIPGSVIVIGERKGTFNKIGGTVAIKGNVNKPGVYYIQHNKTRLKEVIENAGGFSNQAYLPLASIVRRNGNNLSSFNHLDELMKLFQYSDLTLEDTIRYIMDVNMIKPIVSCDFVSAFKFNNEKDNILLQDGDVITVPSNPGKVYVFGQVNRPGFVEFEENQSMDWYVQKAGGYGERAEEDRSRIIRGNTLVWVPGDEGSLVNAGDMIYVPRPPDIPKSVELQNYGIITSIVLAVVSIASIIINLLPKGN